MVIDRTDLNSQQDYAINRLTEFLFDKNERFITIQGFAGVGKTFLIQRFLQGVCSAYPKMRVAVSAPTNSAVSVLKDFGSKAGLSIPSNTIHSMLGLSLSNDSESRSVKKKRRGTYADFHLVVIDECSMLNRMVIQEIVRNTHTRMKVIFMGDIYQLNPVGEKVSESFKLADQIRLTQVMRQEEGHLLSTIAEVRQQCIDGTRPSKVVTALNAHDDGVHVFNDLEFRDVLLAQFDTDEFRSNPNFCRALAWTNREVVRLNTLVRNSLYGKDAPTFLENEPVTTLNPVYGLDEELVFSTNEQCRVLHAEESFFSDYLDNRNRKYKIWRLTLESECKTRNETVMTIHRDSQTLFNNRLNELGSLAKAKKAPWSRFWQFKEQFCDVRHVYANTVHRAQGQTIENTFLNVKDLRQNENVEELRRLYYVGTSRASRNLIVNCNNLVAA